ncbi:MAG: DUF362 domain-containing protein [Halanaerobiales bacterium]|nr:DUF362 domain-containing protein [Halanaerobiales bacterium]
MNSNQIFINYGDKGRNMVKNLLSEIQIETELKKDYLIALKPNLINATKTQKGATTDPEIVEGIIEYLKDKGFNNIIIMEGSWVGENTDRAFQYCGYEELSQKHKVPLHDLQQDEYITKSYKDLKIEIAVTALNADYIINVPVLKGHSQTKITCALKNLKGCISNSEKRKFHRQGLHKPIAYLNKLLKQDLIIIDGIYGDLDFEEGGNPVKMDRIMAAKDPVLIDSYITELMGYSQTEVEYIEIAHQIGVGNKDWKQAEIKELNQNQSVKINYKSEKLKKYADKIVAKDVCSACYDSLIQALKKIDKIGKFEDIPKKIKIGQGYQGEKIKGIGIGNCCQKAEEYIEGCPPDAEKIMNFIINRSS